MLNKEFISVSQVAKLLGISRIAIFNKVKKGQIKAEKIGRNYVFSVKHLDDILGKTLPEEDKKQIDAAIERTIREYGETLKLLGNE